MLILVSMSMASLGTPAAARGCEALSPAELSVRLYTGTAEPLTAERRARYERCIGTLLEEDLWTERDMYDAGHYLMLPMYYAFFSGDEAYVSRFAAFFRRFMEDVSGPDIYRFRVYDVTGVLKRVHFLYLATQFMRLCDANGYGGLIPAGLAELTQEMAADYLLTLPAHWGIEPTVIQHIQSVLGGKNYDADYKGVIQDAYCFALAILCDLNGFYRTRGEPHDAVLDTAADLAYQIFQSPALNVETDGGGWLLQPGGWSDYPDYAYAGNERVTEDIQPKPREDIVEDSSHFHRMPLWLRSFLSAQADGGRQALFFLRRRQLANQMINYVLQKVDGQWLCATFMDGTNGVYRYEYHEKGVGLAGYDLSGTFLLGWWSLLDDGRITECYQEILECFPMKGDRSNPYFDHATVREQNPFFDADTAFDNGMFECMTACAAALMPAA